MSNPVVMMITKSSLHIVSGKVDNIMIFEGEMCVLSQEFGPQNSAMQSMIEDFNSNFICTQMPSIGLSKVQHAPIKKIDKYGFRLFSVFDTPFYITVKLPLTDEDKSYINDVIVELISGKYSSGCILMHPGWKDELETCYKQIT